MYEITVTLTMLEAAALYTDAPLAQLTPAAKAARKRAQDKLARAKWKHDTASEVPMFADLARGPIKPSQASS